LQLNWKEHIEKKETNRLKEKEVNWLLGKKPHLSTENRLLINKAVIKLIQNRKITKEMEN